MGAAVKVDASPLSKSEARRHAVLARTEQAEADWRRAYVLVARLNYR